MIKLILALALGAVLGAKFPAKVNAAVDSLLGLAAKAYAWVKAKFAKKA